MRQCVCRELDPIVLIALPAITRAALSGLAEQTSIDHNGFFSRIAIAKPLLCRCDHLGQMRPHELASILVAHSARVICPQKRLN
jgi:hypothetical protein